MKNYDKIFSMKNKSLIKIHFLNTIWSDAILLESNNHYGMIDTGSAFYYPMVNEYLNKLNITKLDFIILTHFHSDHYGNISNIINDYNVNTLYMKRYYGLDGSTAKGYASNLEYIQNEFKNYNNIVSLAINKTNIIYIDELNTDELEIPFFGYNIELFNIRNTLFNIYNNPESIYYHEKKFNENYNSIGIFIKINRFNIFLAGDVTCSDNECEDVNKLAIKMVNRIYEKHNINHIDVYKSAHHGGSGANPLELCKLLKAKYVIITNTDRWLDNYSTKDNLRLSNKNVKIFQTDHQKIIFNITNKNFTSKIEIQGEIEESLFITLNKD